MINKSWFTLELYTPTPPEITEDFTYIKDDINTVNLVQCEEIEYKQEQGEYVYLVEELNTTYKDGTEVIHIE